MEKSLSPAENRTSALQSVTRPYTDWNNSNTKKITKSSNNDSIQQQQA
jgi:hypothetical protein